MLPPPSSTTGLLTTKPAAKLLRMPGTMLPTTITLASPMPPTPGPPPPTSPPREHAVGDESGRTAEHVADVAVQAAAGSAVSGPGA